MSGNCDIPVTITSDPAIEPDSEVARRVEGGWFGNLFGRLFDACQSPLTEDYRRLSVDVVRHGA